MNPTLKKIIQYVILIAIGVLLIYLSLKKTSVSRNEVFQAFQSANIFWIIASLIISFFSHYARAYRWNYLLENYQYKTDILTSNAAVFIGYLANYGLPRMGEISRCAVVSKYNKIPFDIALGTVIAERAVDMLLMFILFLFVIIFEYQDLQSLLNKYIFSPIASDLSMQKILIVLIAIVIVAVLLFFINKRKQTQSSFIDKIFQIIKNLTQPLLSIHKIKRPIGFWLWSISIWLLYFSSMYTCSLAMPETMHLGFFKISVLFLFGTIGVIITPGGIGAYHFLITELLLFYNVEKASAVAFPWLIWGSQFLLILFLGGLSFILLPLFHNKNTSNA